jgi:hypothetical protein
MSTTRQCAARICKVIATYNSLAGLSKADGAETSLADLLADIRHYCRAKQIDFDDLLRRANNYFTDEQDASS